MIAAMPMDLILSGGTVVTQNDARDVLSADVLVQDGRITAVGTRKELEKLAGRGARQPRPRLVIDATDRLVIPGLIQSHIHLCQTLFRGLADDLALLDWLKQRIWPLEGAHTHRSLRASARLGIAELLRGGTTAIQDMGTVHHTDAVFEALEETGIRAVAGKAMMDRQEGAPKGLREHASDAQATEASLRESIRLCEAWNGAGSGRIRYGFAPRFALSCTTGLLRETAEEARHRDARIHTHASENKDEIAAVRAETGLPNIEYLHSVGLTGHDVGLAHCVHLSRAEEKLLAKTQTNVLHCPSSNLKLGSGIARIPELLALGVPVSIGADGAPCNNNLDAFLETRLAALLQKPRLGPMAMPANVAFDLVTRGGARALGLADQIGSIEVGKRADLVVVDVERSHTLPGGDVYSRLVYAARPTDVTDVVVDGHVVVRNGVLSNLDEDAVRAEAKSALKALLTRADLA